MFFKTTVKTISAVDIFVRAEGIEIQNTVKQEQVV